MNRLVMAVLILFAVLFGLRMTNSSFFSRNVANRLDSGAPATRSTGFSTAAKTGTATTGQSSSTSTVQQNLSTTPLPPGQQSGQQSADDPPANVIRSW